MKLQAIHLIPRKDDKGNDATVQPGETFEEKDAEQAKRLLALGAAFQPGKQDAGEKAETSKSEKGKAGG